MTDHAILIPTSEGPVGGIISAPPGDARAALALLGGYGRPARSGINSLWTRIARRLADEQGVVVLRVDYSREGETLPIGEGVSGQVRKSQLDQLLLDQVLAWFRQRLDGLDLFLAGSCAGARMAIELAGPDPDAVARTFLIVPHLRSPVGDEPVRGEDPDAELSDAEIVDPLVLEHFRAILARAPCVILLGERDRSDLPSLERLLGPSAAGLEIEVVPGVAIHFLDQPHLQREAERWLLDGVARALAEREPIATRPP